MRNGTRHTARSTRHTALVTLSLVTRALVTLALVTLSLAAPLHTLAASSAFLSPQPKFTAIDANGDPYVGGKLYTYSTGTTTPKATWTDATKGTPNTNPVIMDAHGQANVWIDASDGAYRFRFLTSDDQTVWTVDGITDRTDVAALTALVHPAIADLFEIYDDSASAAKQITLLNLLGNRFYPNYSAADQGSTGNSDTIKYAVDTLGANDGTIFLRNNSGSATTAYTLSTSETVPANITLEFETGAYVADDAGNASLTINGNLDAQLRQIFDFTNGTGVVVISLAGPVGWVYPEWWGALPDDSTDSTAALKAALKTGVNVQLMAGTYLHTGDLGISKDHQKMYGVGPVYNATNSHGTTLKKTSGTLTGITVSNEGVELCEMTVDNNSLAGNAIQMFGHQALLRNLEVKGQGGTDFALWISSVNLSSFENLLFADGNYGHIEFDSVNQSLYSSFRSVRLGTASSDIAMKIRYSTEILFSDLYFENEIDITGTGAADTVTNIHFNNLRCENVNTSGPLIDINGGSNAVENINFQNIRLAQNVASAFPFFDVSGVNGFSVDKAFLLDPVSAADRPYIIFDSVILGTLRNILIYNASGNSHYLVDCNGKTRSDYISTDNIYSRSGGTIVNRWKTSVQSSNNDNLTHTWVSGTGASINLSNLKGSVTITNITSQLSLLNLSSVTGLPIAFSDGDATPDVSLAGPGTGILFKTANTGGTTITNFDSGKVGMEFSIVFDDSVTVVDFTGTALRGNAGVDWSPAQYDTMRVVFDGTLWYCTVNDTTP